MMIPKPIRFTRMVTNRTKRGRDKLLAIADLGLAINGMAINGLTIAN